MRRASLPATVPALTRMATVAAVAVIVFACGGSSPTTPAPPTLPTPIPVVPVTLSGQVVNAFDTSERLPAAQVRTPVQEVSSGADGTFALTLPTPPAVALTVSKSGFLDRVTAARVPGSSVQVSLIPATFDLVAFEQFTPRAGGLRRWTSNPRVLVLTSVVDYQPGTEFRVTDRSMSAGVVACTTSRIAEDITAMTGGALSLAGLDVATLEPGSRVNLGSVPEGTIVVMGARTLGANGRGNAYVGGTPSVFVRGAVWLNFDDLPFCTAQADFVVMHELGHALGYGHVFAQPSVMGSPPVSSLSRFDRDAIALVYRRPPGNRAPDVDPAGALLGLRGVR